MESTAAGRKSVYTLLLLVAVSSVAGHILTSPGSFSTNDQSRWSTIRALVETGSYSIGYREETTDGKYRDMGIIALPGWHTFDVVMHPATRRFYSSKPTLLPTVLAAEYWILRNALGLNLRRNRLAVSRTILFTINLLPFAIYLLLFARIVELLGTTEWGRLFVFTTAAFGTFVSGFLVSLNNHTVAAMGVFFALYYCIRIHLHDDRRSRTFLLAGLFAGWTMCNELPAAAFAAGLMFWLMRLAPRETLRYAFPAMLLPVMAYLSTQYLAVGTILPTYAHGDWYLFAGSYWRNPDGLDRADEPKLLYALNLLIGHTGILSLTPVLVLGWIGMVRTTGYQGAGKDSTVLSVVSRLTLALTVVTFAFYVFRTNSYGGITAGPRWFFWLVPLWLITMLPEADRWGLDQRRRIIAGLLLAFSIGTANHALTNPWQESLLFTWFKSWGIISY